LPKDALSSNWLFAVTAAREGCLGIILGLTAALPLDAARMGGRFMDLFRGASAEAALPEAGTRESATGDVLHQLLLSVVAAGPLFPFITTALLRSFVLVRVGGGFGLGSAALQVISLVGTAMGTGLAVGAPIAAVSLLTDLFVGLAGRAAPQMGARELSAPLRIGVGGALGWLTLGLVCDRLLELVAKTPSLLEAVTAR
jgi:flagellar biosynthetic protein FliR/type III secretion protein T